MGLGNFRIISTTIGIAKLEAKLQTNIDKSSTKQKALDDTIREQRDHWELSVTDEFCFKSGTASII